jgi:hypothetical protein
MILASKNMCDALKIFWFSASKIKLIHHINTGINHG